MTMHTFLQVFLVAGIIVNVLGAVFSASKQNHEAAHYAVSSVIFALVALVRTVP